MSIRLAELPQALLEGVLLRHAKLLLLSWRQRGIRWLLRPSESLVIESLDVRGPGLQRLILGEVFLELMQVAGEMHPATLMQALMDVVARVEIAAQHSLEGLAEQFFDHVSAARMVVLVIANGGGGHTPDIAILAVFSPSRFIGLHGGTGADLGLEVSEQRLGRRVDAMQ